MYKGESKEVVVVIGAPANDTGMRTASAAFDMSHITVGQAKRLNRQMRKRFGNDYDDEYRHDGKYVVALPFNHHAANDSRRKLLGIQSAVEKATGKVIPIDATNIR